ncbi:hypothetical protein FSP39_020468 [Pinctada imbricata]|uniref:C2 domain-containing protein n=1 Tax=Pinctada imbricata TaxID=66713 RepID=A0AA89C762_PINIB|nr:hypothetical protein FSP39_020468 [Pinctada imbricata]
MAQPFNTFQAGTAAVPATQVEISVSCRKLRDMDILSKSDPMCVLFTYDLRANTYYEFARTEVIQDNLNPNFVKKFVMNYFFEESQKLKFEVYDVDSQSSHLDKHEEVSLHFRATHLDKKDFFGKSDPYLVFYRANEDNSYTIVHKTEVIKNTLNPTWKPFTIHARALCNGDYDRSIRVECYDWDSDGGHDLIGEFTTNLRELSRGAGSNNQFPVIHPKKKQKKKKYKNSGEVILLECGIHQQHTFLDYIQSGTEMNFTVAVDFTASNGNPSSPTSLHYLNPYGTPNSYAAAIQAVGEIIQDYDSDKLFPALGFGARMSDGSVHHEFAMNFNPSNPYCQGISGVLQAYYNSLQKVQLYGPTNFAPVINHVARFAQAMPNGTNYFVLLIITDGVITDMPQTCQAIVNASRLPMSIIIVGVGDADFTAMNILDGDDVRVSANGQYAERDIVQFVPFSDFVNRGTSQMSQAALAKEVLAEIPEQFLSYMKKHNIKPKIQANAPPS